MREYATGEYKSEIHYHCCKRLMTSNIKIIIKIIIINTIIIQQHFIILQNLQIMVSSGYFHTSEKRCPIPQKEYFFLQLQRSEAPRDFKTPPMVVKRTRPTFETSPEKQPGFSISLYLCVFTLFPVHLPAEKDIAYESGPPKEQCALLMYLTNGKNCQELANMGKMPNKVDIHKYGLLVYLLNPLELTI